MKITQQCAYCLHHNVHYSFILIKRCQYCLHLISEPKALIIAIIRRN